MPISNDPLGNRDHRLSDGCLRAILLAGLLAILAATLAVVWWWA